MKIVEVVVVGCRRGFRPPGGWLGPGWLRRGHLIEGKEPAKCRSTEEQI